MPIDLLCNDCCRGREESLSSCFTFIKIFIESPNVQYSVYILFSKTITFSRIFYINWIMYINNKQIYYERSRLIQGQPQLLIFSCCSFRLIVRNTSMLLIYVLGFRFNL